MLLPTETKEVLRKTFLEYYATDPLSTVNGETCKIGDKDCLFFQGLKDYVTYIVVLLEASFAQYRI